MSYSYFFASSRTFTTNVCARKPILSGIEVYNHRWSEKPRWRCWIQKKGTASRLSPSILYFLILRAIDKHGRRLSICANVFIFFEVEKLIWCFFQKNSVRVGELFSVWNSDCCWKRKGNSLPATPFFQSSFRLNPKMNCSPNKSFSAKIANFLSLNRNEISKTAGKEWSWRETS